MFYKFRTSYEKNYIVAKFKDTDRNSVETNIETQHKQILI